MAKLEKLIPLEQGWINLVADVPEKSPKALIIFCHGLTGDRSGPQRILTHWAKTLSENQFLVARFDFRGSGDSSGKFEQTSFATMQEDLETVIQWCYSNFLFSYLVLAGLSVGGLVALKTIASRQDCLALCLFSTDLNDIPTFILEGDPVPIREGQFFLSQQFFNERIAFFPKRQLLSVATHRFLFYGENDQKIRQIINQLGSDVRTIEVKDAGHLFESLTARSTAIKWLIKELNQLIEICI